MISRAIPRGSESLPVIGLGTWQAFDAGGSAAARAPLAEVLERFAGGGGRVIDSSPMYGQAEVVGALRQHAPDAFLATKVWTSGREEGIAQMERSMRRLRAGTIDLMQVHNLVDWRVHLATLRAWKAEGRIRYLGVTHYTRSAFADLETILRKEDVDFVQLPLSLGVPDAADRLLPVARERGVAVLVNQPFEEGALFSRLRGVPFPSWTAQHGCRTWAEVALKWIVSHEDVTCVIPATRNAAHMESNLRAGAEPLFDPEERKRLRELVRRA
jgi:diketogulonate reductase-like aldo/keto reductase